MKKSCFFVVVAVLAGLVACQEQKPSKAEEFRQEVLRRDSAELDSARVAVLDAEREIGRLETALKEFKGRFVLEKDGRYQTVGYWVLPDYKGSKERFTFFPEVEETGKMLLVNIDGKRRYSFTEVSLESDDYGSLLPKGLSQKQRAAVDECFAFARTMKLLDEARKRKERMELKVRFYEEKRERGIPKTEK